MKTKILIEVEAEDITGFKYSMEEAVADICNGCATGFNNNETENYSFEVKKEYQGTDREDDFFFHQGRPNVTISCI